MQILAHAKKRQESPHPALNERQIQAQRKRPSIRPSAFAHDPCDYWSAISPEPVAIVDGILFERQIVVLAGTFNMGKSPLLRHLAFAVVHGIPWLGRETAQRPIIVVDSESEASAVKRDLCLLAERFELDRPDVPGQIEPYLRRGDPEDFGTKELRCVLESNARGWNGRNHSIEFLRERLRVKPDALVIVDPSEVFFQFDRLKAPDIRAFYGQLHSLFVEFSHCAILLTLNLRKTDRRNGRANLLREPWAFLEEVCGSLDLMNRSDSRLAVDFYRSAGEPDEDVKVLNGAIRGASMNPILFETYQDSENRLAGFQELAPDDARLLDVFSGAQAACWAKLPQVFDFMCQVRRGVAKSTLSRTINTAKAAGLLVQNGYGTFQKV